MSILPVVLPRTSSTQLFATAMAFVKSEQLDTLARESRKTGSAGRIGLKENKE
jgi:hypothetical protein